MEADELKKILEDHKKWLNGDGGARANLAGANLAGADLEGANLAGANLRRANLAGANLDYSCLPLWCGGQFRADARICKQLVAHTLRIMELSDQGSPELIKLMGEYKAGWRHEEGF